uniref:Reverse transcriptase zinc-binding domain-containing protein n=1 Tax=Aegilops tauschii subsp. strangulata TaxID=200361 RepID=A0A453RT16_AEGTS
VDRLNTRNMLKRRYYNIGTNLDCLLCGEHIEETVEHLFFHCTFIKRCWCKLNITWPTVGDHLDMMTHLKAIYHQ